MKDPRLQELVSRLTDAELEAVTLCFIEGYGIRGASRRLNIAPSSVRDRLEGVRRKARSLAKATEVEGRSLAVTVADRTALEGTRPESGPYRAGGTGLPGLDDWIKSRDARDFMVDETGRDENRPVPGGTLAGDERRLRGIPVVGRGIGGVSPGTRPGG